MMRFLGQVCLWLTVVLVFAGMACWLCGGKHFVDEELHHEQIARFCAGDLGL
jgi:hypothetical protein